MRIVVDINHPAHVHYFKNFIWEMERRGHEILITASKKDVSIGLLDNYGFDYIKMESYGNSLIKKLMSIPLMDLKMYKAVKSFKPEIFLGFGSIRAAHVSFLLRKPCINFEDTEHSMEQVRLYLPFINAVCTPSCFKKDLGHKQVRFNGYMELAYLHPNYFTPNPAVLDEIGVSKEDTFIILRFVSWSASHDIGQYGIKNKIELVRELEKYGRVLITSEGKLPKELERYKIKVSPEKLHDLLYYASLYVGDGGTTATEAAILGTPSILINSEAKYCGIHNELMEKYSLQFYYNNQRGAFQEVLELLNMRNIKQKWKNKKEKMLKDKIDVTKFMLEFIENLGGRIV